MANFGQVIVSMINRIYATTNVQDDNLTDAIERVCTTLENVATLPSGISAIATGNYTVSTAFTTSRQTITHGLGTTPDLVIFFATANVATANSMLLSMRSSLMNYRSGYNLHSLYHGNNTTSTVTYLNSNSTSYGVSNMTATSFQIASVSSSYYWRAGTYKWVAIKFS